MRAFLVYLNNSIEMTRGETLVGRGLASSIRFNDASVSRRHLLFRFDGETLEAMNLSTSNGTLVNGLAIDEPQALNDGDELRIGKRHVVVRLETDSGSQSVFEETTEHNVQPDDPGYLLPPESAGSGATEAPADRKQTRELPRIDLAKLQGESQTAGEPRTGGGLVAERTREVELPDVAWRNCPACGARLPADVERCTACRAQLPVNRPTTVTRAIKLKGLNLPPDPIPSDRRIESRVAVDLPVFYASDILTFDAVARDLSASGVFVATELLDDIGTSCRVTLLPDGAPPVVFAGQVCHAVLAHVGEQGRPPGIGVRFTEMGRAARTWLFDYLQRRQ